MLQLADMSRVKHTVRNTSFGILRFAVQIILQFAVRTIFIRTLGIKFLGIDNLFLNVIAVLSIAELGVGAAIAYSMYKPAANNDIEKVKSLTRLYFRINLIIAVIVFSLGLAIIPFLPLLMGGSFPDIPVNLHIVYLVFLINAIVPLLIVHKQVLFLVYQRDDIQSKIVITRMLIVKGLQIIGLLLLKNYYLFVGLLLIGTILELAITILTTRKCYPEIRGRAKRLDIGTKKTIKKNVGATAIHRIAGAVIFSFDSIFISAFFGLILLGTVSNYILIISSVTAVIGIFHAATRGSVGNIIAKESVEKNFQTFKMINQGYLMFTGLCTVLMFCLFQPFIGIWLGKDLLLPFIVMLSIVIRFYFTNIRGFALTYKDCAGLMWNDWWKPIAEIIVNISLTLLFIHLFDVEGIFFATVVSTVLLPLWVEPFILHKHYFKKSVWPYFGRLALFTFVTAGAGALAFCVCSFLPTGIIFLILRGLVSLSIVILIYFVFYGFTREFKQGLQLTKDLLLRKRKT